MGDHQDLFLSPAREEKALTKRGLQWFAVSGKGSWLRRPSLKPHEHWLRHERHTKLIPHTKLNLIF